MRISQLIEALGAIQGTHGDLRVCIDIEDGNGIGLMLITDPVLKTANNELTADPPNKGEVVVEIQ